MKFLMVTLCKHDGTDLELAIKIDQIAAIEPIDEDMTIIYMNNGTRFEVTQMAADLLEAIEAKTVGLIG